MFLYSWVDLKGVRKRERETERNREKRKEIKRKRWIGKVREKKKRKFDLESNVRIKKETIYFQSPY